MSELEDEIISELYFVTAYEEVFAQLACSEEEFCNTLVELMKKEFVAQYERKDDFEKRTEIDFTALKNYSYLATKKGLLVHTGMG